MIIVTGMSGAGKTRAVAALEDIGYYCVDNLPPTLISRFVDLCNQSNQSMKKVAVVIDTRGVPLYGSLQTLLVELKNQFNTHTILFLDSTDEELVRRYKETRRRHPLMDESSGSVYDAVKKEREMLEPLKAISDYVIDTTHTSIGQLKETLSKLFVDEVSTAFSINCMSFGFKYGFPSEADLMFDVRCLPNPYYIDEFRPLTGLAPEIKEYVMRWSQTEIFLEKLYDMIDFLLPLYVNEGKCQLVIAIGCTGGKHRSVVLTEQLAAHLTSMGQKVYVNHRDIDKK